MGKTIVDYPERMTADQVATFWAVSPETVRLLCREGKLPGAFLVGSQWRIPKAGVLDYERRMADESVEH
jgi:excisionase family DNA binding protein